MLPIFYIVVNNVFQHNTAIDLHDSDLTILFNVDKLESGVTMRNNNVENCKQYRKQNITVPMPES